MAPAFIPWRRRRKMNEVLITAAIGVAMHPDRLQHLPEKDRPAVKELAEAMQKAANPMLQTTFMGGRNRGPLGSVSNGPGPKPPTPINVSELAARTSQHIAPSSSVIPAEIEVALRRQGVDWVEPFAPGRPLVPYYGYDRRPRGLDYMPGRNITTDSRPDRLPFAVIKQVIEGYDIASICIRHTVNDIRSMKLDFGPMEGYTGNVQKEVLEVKRFLKRPDGVHRWPTWLAAWMMDVLRYDAGCMWKERNADGTVRAFKLVQGSTIAPILDYYGDRPEPPAPAYQQFIQGLPWDWLTTDDVIYEPQWPINEDPYGVAPIETCLLNANTDVRLQLFFLQFFTEGTVPEMLIQAPADASDADGLREIQEMWDDWYLNNQKGRHGARWIPAGSKPFPYKPQQFDPKLAEYVMRRTVAAFGMVPEDLGFTETVNRATADTQMDTQFRLTTLPNTEYYEAILDSMIQDDLQLPVACHFDTGREKEDRLMEAQAHQIYVQIGAESSDEVRDRVLGLPIDNENRVGRFFESPRVGPVPLQWMEAVQGEIDPTTLSPRAGTVQPIPFLPIPDMKAAVDDTNDGIDQAAGDQPGGDNKPAAGDKKPAAASSATPKKPAAKPAQKLPPGAVVPVGGLPKTATPKKGPKWVDAKPGQLPKVRTKGPAVDRRNPSRGGRPLPHTVPGQAAKATAGITSGTSLAGVDRGGDDDDAQTVSSAVSRDGRDEEEARKELSRWRENARNRVKGGRSPRRFVSDILPVDVVDTVWKALDGATSRAQVDAAFIWAEKEMAKPKCNGLALRAADTGRVLMLQRAMDPDGDYDAAEGKWEFPGGRSDDHPEESPEEGAVREWEEEVGIKMPKKAQKVGEWNSSNGVYRGHIFEIPRETKLSDKLNGRNQIDNPDGDHFEAVAWMDPDRLHLQPDLRQELKDDIELVQRTLAGGGRLVEA